MTDPRPRIILVHGAWVGAWEFEPFATMLRERGWRVDAVDLPSTGARSGLDADAAAVTAAIERADESVVLVGHSYGGVPVTQAGSHPAVERIVYVCAFALDAGESLLSSLGGLLPAVWHGAAGQVTLGEDRDALIDILAADLPPGAPRQAAEVLAEMFRPQSEASFTDVVTEAAWRRTPTTYIVGERDELVPTALQEFFAGRIGDEVVRVPHGHAPFQENPSAFADLIARLADPARDCRSVSAPSVRTEESSR